MANFLVHAATTSCILLAASLSPASSMPAVYSVGDGRGWKMPAGNGTESYNHWAKRNSFQVGDILDFKYANDSVLLVNHDEYKQCSTESPASRFTDGDTKFKFDRAGAFYFISGAPDHCEAGQRMMVHVVAHSTLAASPPPKPPASAPSAAVIRGPGGASSPGTPSYGSSTGSMDSATPSPLAEPSGASRRAIAAAAGFSVVTVLLLVGVVTMLA